MAGSAFLFGRKTSCEKKNGKKGKSAGQTLSTKVDQAIRSDNFGNEKFYC